MLTIAGGSRKYVLLPAQHENSGWEFGIDMMDARERRNPADVLSVEEEVLEWIITGRF
jgi:hypothetical protein